MGKITASFLSDMRHIQEPSPKLAKSREEKIRRLGKKIASMIVVDKELPTAMISRYAATVCLAGIESNPSDLRGRREWVDTLNRVLKTEIVARNHEDKDSQEDTFRNLAEMVEASGLINELEGEIEALEREESVGSNPEKVSD